MQCIKSIKFLQYATSVSSLRNISTNQNLFAGHSKWSNIKHIKALKDGQKADLFTKLGRQIRIAILEGGNVDPNLNAQLRSIIDHAVKQKMPIAAVNKIITGFNKDKTNLKKGYFELKLISKNVYIICDVFSDNFVRTKQELNTLIRKTGVASVASIRHFFDEKGIIITKMLGDNDIEKSMETCTDHAIESGAEDVNIINADERCIEFMCAPTHLINVKRNLESMGYNIDIYEKSYLPKVHVRLSEQEIEFYNVFKNKLLLIDGIDNVHDNIE